MAVRDVSPLAAALDRVGDRWTLRVVAALLGGPSRFGELADSLPGIAPNVLTQRLRQLEQDGLIVSSPYSGRPPRFVYQLTGRGEALAGAVRLLAYWGSEHSASDAEPTIHQACGSAAEPRWWCPTCERIVEDPELEDVRWI